MRSIESASLPWISWLLALLPSCSARLASASASARSTSGEMETLGAPAASPAAAGGACSGTQQRAGPASEARVRRKAAAAAARRRRRRHAGDGGGPTHLRRLLLRLDPQQRIQVRHRCLDVRLGASGGLGGSRGCLAALLVAAGQGGPGDSALSPRRRPGPQAAQPRHCRASHRQSGAAAQHGAPLHQFRGVRRGWVLLEQWSVAHWPLRTPRGASTSAGRWWCDQEVGDTNARSVEWSGEHSVRWGDPPPRRRSSRAAHCPRDAGPGPAMPQLPARPAHPAACPRPGMVPGAPGGLPMVCSHAERVDQRQLAGKCSELRGRRS